MRERNPEVEGEFIVEYVRFPDTETRHSKSLLDHSPISALNQAHEYLQDVMKIAPGAYQIVRLARRYLRTWNGKTPWQSRTDEFLESDFDLPDTPNPDLAALRLKRREARKAKEATATMDFYDEVKTENPNKK